MFRHAVDPRRYERMSQTLLTGVFAILPVALTLGVLAWIARFLHDLVGPSSACGRVLQSVGMSIVACEVTAYLIGLIGAVVMTYALGRIIESGVSRRWSDTLNDALRRVPLVGTVYDASKHLTNMFERKPESGPNMTPVMCYFGDDHGAGTPALMPTPEILRLSGNEYRLVIIPTAPVPFGGALLCVKASWVVPLACGFEDLVGIYMSMGVSAPRCLRDEMDGEPERIAAPATVS